MHIETTPVTPSIHHTIMSGFFACIYTTLGWLGSLNLFVWLGLTAGISGWLAYAFNKQKSDYNETHFNTTIPKIDRNSQNNVKFRYKTSMATICLPGNIKQKLLAISKSGFDGVELMFNDMGGVDPYEVKQYADSLNLNIALLQPFRNFEGWKDEIVFQQKLHDLEKVFKMMKILNTDMLLLCSNVDNNSSGDYSLIINQLKQASKLAQTYNIKLAFENLSWAIYIRTFDQLLDAVNHVDEPNFGICIDSFHVNMYQTRINQYNLMNKIFIVQFCDGGSNISQLPTRSDKDRHELVEYARNFRYFPGQGGFRDLQDQYHHLQVSNYTGYVSLEVFNQDFSQFKGDLQYISDDGFRSLIWLQIKDLLHNKQFTIKSMQVNQWPRFIGSYSSSSTVADIDGLKLDSLKNITIFTDSSEHLNLRLKYLQYNNFLIANKIIIKTEKEEEEEADENENAGGANENFRLLNTKKSNRIILKVLNRTEYNRLMLFCSIGLNLEKLHEEYRQDYSCELPIRTSFGYRRVGLNSITKLDRGGYYDFHNNNQGNKSNNHNNQNNQNNQIDQDDTDDINSVVITISIT